MGRIAKHAALAAGAIVMALSPIAAQANTRAQDSTVYAVGMPGAQADGDQDSDRKKHRKRGAWISNDDLDSILLLIGGFGLAFAVILAGGSSDGTDAPNQSNGAN